MIDINGIKVFREIPICAQDGCGKRADYELVWTSKQFYCEEHTHVVINVADAMGFPTPRATLERIVWPDGNTNIMPPSIADGN